MTGMVSRTAVIGRAVNGPPQPRWLVLGAGGLAAAGLLATGEEGPVLCPYRICTGGYCPGCGLTRAAARLVRGDIGGAWHHHPYLLVAAVQAVAAVVVVAVVAARGHRPGHPVTGAGLSALRRRLPALLVANVVVLVAIWAARLALGAIPAPFG